MGILWSPLYVSIRMSWNSRSFSKREVRTLVTSVDVSNPNTLVLAIFSLNLELVQGLTTCYKLNTEFKVMMVFEEKEREKKKCAKKKRKLKAIVAKLICSDTNCCDSQDRC